MKKVRGNKNGISTYLAILILIILVIAAGLLIWLYTIGYIGGGASNLPTGRRAMLIQSVAQGGGQIFVYVKNSGAGSVKLDRTSNARVYVEDARVDYLIGEPEYQQELPEGKVCTVKFPVQSLWFRKTIKIRITADDGTFAEVSTKIAAPTIITIQATAGPGGDISPKGVIEVPYGSDQRFTWTPDPHYYVSALTVDGVPITPIPTDYAFIAVTEGHTIDVQFHITEYTITAEAKAGGSITPTGSVLVPYGSDKTFTITPNSGYHIVDVVVDSISQGPITTYTFTNVNADHTISASFGVNTGVTHIIWAEVSGLGGKITPSEAVIVNHGATQVFTIAPNTGNHIVDVVVDDVSKGAVPTYTFTNVEADHRITASFAPDFGETYIITASAGANGKINPSGDVSVNAGATQVFTITPNAGYVIMDVVVDGVSQGAVPSYTFTNVRAPHTITASFFTVTGNTYIIEASAGAHGRISPSGQVQVNEGATQVFTITPDNGYHVADVLVDGSSVGAFTSYAFTDVKGPHTISASFAINSYKITSSAGTGGIIVPSGTITVTYGASQQYTIQCDVSQYHIVDVKVDGASQGIITSYTFNNIASDHTIVATFAPNTGIIHTITVNAGDGGTIAPPGPSVIVNDGATQVFTITSDPGYHTVDVVVDGISQGAITRYTFTNIVSNHDISATFALDTTVTYIISASAGPNGQIIPSGDLTVYAGVTQVYRITPNAGYRIDDVKVDGASQGIITSYTFRNIDSDHTIVAIFVRTTHIITSISSDGGTINPEGAVTVNEGADQTFTITPNTGKIIVDVVVDGVSQGAVSSYTFTNVVADHTIVAYFTNEPTQTYTITASVTGSGGTINPIGAVTVNAGATQTFTITPDAGYHIVNVFVDGAPQGALTSYTFTNVVRDHTISATFVITTHIITVTAGPGGAIAPSGPYVVVNDGADQAFTITPDQGNHIVDVVVDGVSQGPITTYIFTNVNADHAIAATFDQTVLTHTITVTTGPGGTITPTGPYVVVNHGINQAFTIEPNAGFHIVDVLVDGKSIGAVESYLFVNVVEDHTISATFTVTTYTVTASVSGTGGTITPSGAVTVNYGSNQAFTIAPDTGKVIVDVVVDGVSQGAVASYTFTNVVADHTIVAYFADNPNKTYTITASVTGSGGAISPAGAVIVNAGATQAFTITPSTGYHIVDVVVDSISQGPITTYTFTNVNADHTIVASFTLTTYTITVTTTGLGTVNPPGPSVTVNEGTDQAFTFTPNPDNHIVNVLVDDVSQGAVSSYTFTDVMANHKLDVQFAPDTTTTFTITAITGPGGTITPPGVTTVQQGTTHVYTIMPDVGFHIVDVVVDEDSKGVITSYTFTNVNADHTIFASFAANTGVTHTIVATAGPNGQIIPVGAVTVDDGATQTFIIQPNTGYHVADVSVDGNSQGAVTQYTFVNIIEDHTIHATFAVDTSTIYTLTTTIIGSGSILRIPNQSSYAAGTSVQLTAIPANGGIFTGWSEDLGGSTNPTSIAMNSNKQVTATFVQLPPSQATSIGWWNWPGTVNIGGTFSALGYLSSGGQGLGNKPIRLVFTRPDGTVIVSTTTTWGVWFPGVFYATFRPDATGTWSVVAQFLGDSTHGASTTPPRTFTVR